MHAAGIDSAGGDSAKILSVNMGGTVNVTNVFKPLMSKSALVNYNAPQRGFILSSAVRRVGGGVCH